MTTFKKTKISTPQLIALYFLNMKHLNIYILKKYRDGEEHDYVLILNKNYDIINGIIKKNTIKSLITKKLVIPYEVEILRRHYNKYYYDDKIEISSNKEFRVQTAVGAFTNNYDVKYKIAEGIEIDLPKYINMTTAPSSNG